MIRDLNGRLRQQAFDNYREASLLQHNSTRTQWDTIRDLNGRLRQQAFDNYRIYSRISRKIYDKILP